MATRSGLIQRLQCLLGRHKRSRGRIQESATMVTSVCRHCGVKMIRVDGKWEKAK